METRSTPRVRRVSRTATTHRQVHGPGFSSHSLRPPLLGEAMDPFLNLDDFHMSEPTFPPHPHAGFSAVTYMFEDSPGTFINRDSRGDRSLIRPGDLHWTEAAGGIIHEEVPSQPGLDCHGLQMFVNLPRAEKDAPARALHLRTEEIPQVTTPEGARIRVLVGRVGDTASPLVPRTRLLFLDVHLPARVSTRLEVPAGWNAFAYVVQGAGRFGPDAEAHELRQGDAAAFDTEGEHVAAQAGDTPLQFLLCAGPPLREPLVQRGPFIASSLEQLQRYMGDYQAGRMGMLTPSF